MGFRPRPDEDKTMIKFSKSSYSTYKAYIDDMGKFLNPEKEANTYLKGQPSTDYLDCKDHVRKSRLSVYEKGRNKRKKGK